MKLAMTNQKCGNNDNTENLSYDDQERKENLPIRDRFYQATKKRSDGEADKKKGPANENK